MRQIKNRIVLKILSHVKNIDRQQRQTADDPRKRVRRQSIFYLRSRGQGITGFCRAR